MRRLARLLALTCGLLSAAVAWPQQAPTSLPAPLAADFASILGNRSEAPAAFSYLGRTAISIIDFPSLTLQGKMFNRLVALVERIGAPRERVLGNEELAEFIRSVGRTDATLAYGNDFLVSELVIFFNLADLGGIRLNPEEIALRQFLIDRQLIGERNGFYQALAPSAVVLSLPQETVGAAEAPQVTLLARKTILAHELSHAEYYTDPAYRNFCRRFWRQEMDDNERAAFRRFLAKGGYNPDKEEMMINETQAYLMHTPDPRAFSATAVGLSESVIERLRLRFRNGFPEMNYQ